MRGYFLLFVYVSILNLGFRCPLVFLLGYIWVDILTPHQLSYSVLSSIPVSLLLGGAVFACFALSPSKYQVQHKSVTIVTLLLGSWMTCTLAWAEVPDHAYEKWDWAIKNILFSCMIPYFIRNRLHLESLVWTIVVSGMAHCLAFGTKFLLSGGGYGRVLGLVSNNTGYGEGSTLAMFAICLIPLVLYLYRFQTFVASQLFLSAQVYTYLGCAILTSIGTYARTGLISISALAVLLVYRSKKRLLICISLLCIATTLFVTSDQAWRERMLTIGDGNETSAMGRVAVWKWTIGYIMQHPLGGGFGMYRINESEMQLENGSLLRVKGKAFHSIYFEVLGEGGVLGLLLYLYMIILAYRGFWRVQQLNQEDRSEWIRQAGVCFSMSLTVFLVGGAFIGVGFQHFIFYLVSIAGVLENLAEQNERE